jgi:predicted N-acetyltransferase YhbS
VSVPEGVTIRPMTPADVEAGLRLCRAARWNQLARDWEAFLSRNPDGARVACRGDGVVVGSVATIRYAPDLAWVAMVLVDPAERGRGIGRALLEAGLALVADVPAVGLDATPLGRPLYLTLGFHDAGQLTRLQRAGDRGPTIAETPAGPARAARTLREADWPAVVTLDREVTGVDRADMLRWLAEGAPAYAHVWEDEATGTIGGFVLGRHGHDFEHLGPVVAPTRDVAVVLAAAALAHVPAGRPVVVDAADTHAGWRAWLRDSGFEPQRPFTRMFRGVTKPLAPRVFAIIGPEFG